VKVADEPVLVPLGDADVAGGLQAHDGIERPLGEVERPHVAPHDPYPVRHTPLLDQPPSLTHLLTADVDPGDLAAVARGDAQRRRPDAAARIKHELPQLQVRHLADQVGLGVERLRQRLATRAEVADMEVVAVEQARVVGDQVEVRADAGRGSSSPHQDRQRQPGRRRQLARGTCRTSVAPGRHEHLSWQPSCALRSPRSCRRPVRGFRISLVGAGLAALPRLPPAPPTH